MKNCSEASKIAKIDFNFSYEEDDLRMSIVSRYRCFDNAEMQAEYHSTENKISLDDVLELLMTVSI